MSNNVSTKESDILWCTNAVNTLGAVNTLTDYVYVLSHVCHLLMQCSGLTTETQRWVWQHSADPAMREPMDSNPNLRSNAVRALLIEYENQVLLPGVKAKFDGLPEAELKQRAARLELFGCWAPGSQYDELIEALFHGFVYVMSHLYGGILKGSDKVREEPLLAVCADILFPHSNSDVPPPSKYVISNASADGHVSEWLAKRYLNIVSAQGSRRVVLRVGRATLIRHFRRLVQYARRYSAERGERINNRLRGFAYLYDQWCNDRLLADPAS